MLDAQLAASPLVRGVRSKAAHHPDPGVRDFVDGPGLWRDPAYINGFTAIAERGLSFELWCYAHQLPEAIGLVREYPENALCSGSLRHAGRLVRSARRAHRADRG